MTIVAEPRAVVLVEGPSDQVALRTLARRHDRDLDAEGISIVSIGGATNIATFLELLGAPRPDVDLAGLCDAAHSSAPGSVQTSRATTWSASASSSATAISRMS